MSVCTAVCQLRLSAQLPAICQLSSIAMCQLRRTLSAQLPFQLSCQLHCKLSSQLSAAPCWLRIKWFGSSATCQLSCNRSPHLCSVGSGAVCQLYYVSAWSISQRFGCNDANDLRGPSSPNKQACKANLLKDSQVPGPTCQLSCNRSPHLCSVGSGAVCQLYYVSAWSISQRFGCNDANNLRGPSSPNKQACKANLLKDSQVPLWSLSLTLHAFE